MSLATGSVRALERHFVGALSLPPRVWLDSVPLSHLVVAGSDAIRVVDELCAVDFGTVESPGTERQIVRISSARPNAVAMRAADIPPWLTARWLNTAGDTVRVEPGGIAAKLEITAAHDVLKQTDFSGMVRIVMCSAGGEELCEELLVRMTARRTHPLGAFDFHGSPQPRGFDFGIVDPLLPPTAAYVLAFESLTSVPMMVTFADLPEWLTFDVDGHRRVGPARGRFFERAAPFKASIRPHCTPELIGSHRGSLHLETNDPRPALRSIDVRFSVRLEPAASFLRAVPSSVCATTARPLRTQLHVENWGRASARISPATVPPSMQVIGIDMTVPASQSDRPGVAAVPMRVFPAQLSPGSHSVLLTFNVEGGAPLRVEVPVLVTASTRTRKNPVVPAAVAALLALLTFTALIVLYLRVLS